MRRGDSRSTKKLLVAEERKVALVGIERVGSRMRTDHNFAIQVRGAQVRRCGLLQCKIRQSVVDEIDLYPIQEKPPVATRQRARLADERIEAVAAKELAIQQKLGVEVLPFRVHVDNGNGSQRSRWALLMPLCGNHFENSLLPRCGIAHRARQFCRRVAAVALRGPEHCVEQCAARIGVDLDQLRSRLTQMEVVAEQSAARARLEARNFGRP